MSTIRRLGIIAMLLTLTVGGLTAQTRDRRVDLEVRCLREANLSSTETIWIVTRCGAVYRADSIGDTWHTLQAQAEGGWHEPHFEGVAAFGNHTAVAVGFLADEHVPHYRHVLRTTTEGQLWDTVHFGDDSHWIHGLHYTSDGHIWMGSAQATSAGHLFYSADSGRTFTTLRTELDTTLSIWDIYMADSVNGLIGDYENMIFSTTDNWRTFRRLPTPRDQGLKRGRGIAAMPLRPWHGMLLVCQGNGSYYTPTDSIQWAPTPLPLTGFEVDTVLGDLWAITDSGQLVLMSDLEHWRVVAEGLDVDHDRICGTLGGRIYLLTENGVVRVGPDGRADTCGFFTREQTLDEVFDKLFKEYWSYANEYLPTLSHGGRLWRTDGSSIYLHDALGWYRIAKPLGVSKILPDPDRSNRIIFLRNDEKTYALDTTGHYEPYTYHNPLESFVKSGLQSVEIATHRGGCFHFEKDIIRYTRHGDQLRESANTVDSSKHAPMLFPADILEHTLSQLGETYSRFPTHADFGMKEGDVDLEKVFAPEGGCTSYSGYRITLVNRNGDTLTVRGSSSADCGGYFPWLLPMNFSWQNAAFVSYQPALWQALRPMMPQDMILRDKLNNNALFDLRPGDLLFYRDTAGMGAAVRESTGEYTHVALVESVGDTVWIIDATQKYGVSRRPFLRKRNDMRPYPDIYRVEHGCYNIDSVLSRARSFVGQTYDNAFLPDNGALYCSELIYEVFLDDCSAKGRHLFETKPMNWRDKEGKIPQYWQEHFKKLEMEVPEGVPGTNPTDMSRSPLLRKL